MLPHSRPSGRLIALRIAGCATWLIALLLLGCEGSRTAGEGNSPAAPLAMGAEPELAGTQGTFYPLDLGNEWHYDRSLVIRFFSPGSTEPSGVEEYHFEEERVLDQTEELFGRTYIVESRTIVQDFPDPDVAHEWIRYRQDRSGLYEADVSIVDPPGPTAKATAVAGAAWEPALRIGADLSAFGPVAIEHPESFRSALGELERRRLRLRGALRGEQVSAPPGNALPDEITRLKYPLHPGSSFAIRDGLLDAHVEALEQLGTPAGRFPAWRIRLVWATGGPDDTILVWFSRCGNLQLYVLAEAALVAPDGTVLGTMQFEEVEVVEELDVQGRPCGARPGPPVLD